MPFSKAQWVKPTPSGRWVWNDTLVEPITGRAATSADGTLLVPSGVTTVRVRASQDWRQGHRLRWRGRDYEIQGVEPTAEGNRLILTARSVPRSRDSKEVIITIGGEEVSIGGVGWYIEEEL